MNNVDTVILDANEAVASHLEQLDIPSLFRIHEKPDPKRVMEFEEIATHFGYSLGIGALRVKRFHVAVRGRDGRKSRQTIETPDGTLPITPRN